MNRSQIFSFAHQLAKLIRNQFTSYKAAFASALKQVNSHKGFYSKMSFRLTPQKIVAGHGAATSSHGYFLGSTQYSVQFTMIEQKPVISEGFWM